MTTNDTEPPVFDYSFQPELPDTADFQKADVLDRTPQIDILHNTIINISDDSFLTISVNGEWGSGKTFFLKMLQQRLNQDNQCHRENEESNKSKYQAIYFNAWEDDFQSDPLISIIGQMKESINDAKYKSFFDDFIDAAIDFSDCIKIERTNVSLKNIIKLFLHPWSGGYAIERYTNYRKSLNLFKIKLKKLSEDVRNQTALPLVFIVDELDRCRPTFAIELLERIKHVFNVPNIVFIFGVNRKQLHESIKSVYGNIDAAEYLQKFFDFNLNLKKATPSRYCKELIRSHKILINIKEVKAFNTSSRPIGKSGRWNTAMEEQYPFWVDVFGFSLREVEQSLRIILLTLSGIAVKNEKNLDTKFDRGWAVTYLVLIRLRFFSIYQRLVSDRCSIKEVIDTMYSRIKEHDTGTKESEKYMDFFEYELYRFVREEDKDMLRNELQELNNGKSIQNNIVSDRTIIRTAEKPKHIGYIMDFLFNENESNWIDLSNIVRLMDLVV